MRLGVQETDWYKDWKHEQRPVPKALSRVLPPPVNSNADGIERRPVNDQTFDMGLSDPPPYGGQAGDVIPHVGNDPESNPGSDKMWPFLNPHFSVEYSPTAGIVNGELVIREN